MLIVEDDDLSIMVMKKIFRDDLVNIGYKNIEVPARGDEFEI